jgi:hypothetical protein
MRADVREMPRNPVTVSIDLDRDTRQARNALRLGDRGRDREHTRTKTARRMMSSLSLLKSKGDDQ